MAIVLPCLIFLTIFLHFVSAQQQNGPGYVPVGASLTATDDVKPWLSPSGDFAFGFQRIQGNDNFVLSIWYDKIPDKTIIWYPKTNATVSPGSKVELINRRGLILSDPQGRQVWTSESIFNLAYGFMNDTGNFVLVGSNLRKIWESFNFPTDTMLPTQVMARGGVINSKMSETNFTGGRFQLRLLEDGNLVLNTLDKFSGSAGDAYYSSDTNDATNSTNSGDQLIYSETGYMYILRRNGERFNLTSSDKLPSGDYYHRATLNSDGVFIQYYYPMNPTGNTSWEFVEFMPENICKTCGLNSVCRLDGNRRNCECPHGFSLIDSGDPSGDCKPDFTPTCNEGYGGDSFDFIELTDIDWPGGDYFSINPTNEEICKTSCLKDCFCAVAIYRDNQCWKKKLPLVNGRVDTSLNVKVFLKFPKSTTLPNKFKQQNGPGSVPIGASLPATDDVKPWVSPSGDFAFGFQRIQGSDNFVLSIWYDKIPDKTIIWYPKTNATVSPGSKVELTNRRGLILSDPQGTQVWTSGSTFNLAYGFMNDTGNFVLVGSNSRNIWESFNFPTDTMLPTQVMARGGVINSKMSDTNFTGGRFQLRLLDDGNLVLNTLDIFSGSAGAAYYSSYTNDATNSGDQLIYSETGYMYILRRNGERFNLTSSDRLPSGDYYHRATLNSDGVFIQYYYPMNPTGNTSWEFVEFMPENICKTCGLNSVCRLDGNRQNCECPDGFSLLDSGDPSGDCKPDFTPTCNEGYGGDSFDFIELTDIDWPGGDYFSINPANEENCKTSCLKDCFCAVAIFRDNQCWKKKLPLFNGRVDTSLNVKVFLKSRNGDSPTQSPTRFSGDNKNQRSLILVGSALLFTSVFVIVILIVVICVGFFRMSKKKDVNPYPSRKVAETNLPRFTYQELFKATDGFKNELGKGAFGIVYKGEIESTIVAVKKLYVVQDSQKEFKTEVDIIAKTHHKNLIQLLGYCDDGEERLLIYEYMSNGTLAVFLFGDVRPCWKQRSYIALGIAKGLSYLHEECSTKIIHCDIKPQNILLDDYYIAKIADFGLAKLLMIDQSRTTTKIRGTKGYVAPEWFRNTLVTVQVDVYSFGVLLLELISCRKCVVVESENEDVEVLTDLAWDYYQEGRLEAFVEDDLEALDDFEKLKTFVMVGLWCVQENPTLRPSMKKVIQMLEGGIEVTEPPCPCPFSVTSY